MQTKLLAVKTARKEDEGIMAAAELLKAGGLVAIPTETVYGLAANALDGRAVRRIFAAKGRPQDNPLIVHIAKRETLESLVTRVPPSAVTLADRFWPGPLTMILPKAACIPDEVSAGLDTVAVRFPSHPVARAIIDASGFPLAAPSANTSGRPSPTRAEHVLHDLDGRIDAVVDGGACGVGVESTVVSLAGGCPRLLRPGGITYEQLQAAVGPVEMDPAVTHALAKNAVAASPGMKYQHYSPKARVVILKGSGEDYIRYVNDHKQEGTVALCFDEDAASLQVPAVPFGSQTDAEEQAQRLFDALRRIDGMGASLAFARCPDQTGVGLAVFNRLIRAAAFEVVEL